MKELTKKQWDALKYPVMMRELSKEEGGGWLAWIPLLGEGLFRMDGETREEALDLLEVHRREAYDLVIASGQPIPSPDNDPKQASGRWLMRVTPRLHSDLQRGAEREGVSFNAYCTSCLERGHVVQSMETTIESTLQTMADRFEETLNTRQLKYEGKTQNVEVSWSPNLIDINNPGLTSELRMAA